MTEHLSTELVWICWILVVGGAASAALQFTRDLGGRMVGAVQALTPYTIVATLVGALVGCFVSPAATTVGLVAAALQLAIAVPAHRAPATATAELRAGRLTLFHSNLLYTNRQPDAAIECIVAAGTDIVAVSELTQDLMERMDDALGDEYPYRQLLPREDPEGLGIWSRVPFRAKPIPGSTMCTAVETALDGRWLTVVLAHPVPPLFDGPRWRHEMRAITSLDDLRSAVVVGDLNVSLFHPAYRRWLRSTGLSDAHVCAGRGWSTSWPVDAPIPPFVRLDHALVGDYVGFAVLTDVDVPGSDHRGFHLSVDWRSQPGSRSLGLAERVDREQVPETLLPVNASAGGSAGDTTTRAVITRVAPATATPDNSQETTACPLTQDDP